ncbi:hypothetical protein HDU83_007483 [Entophlyctis luteolus]|nr:hypothetical protein HDU82_007948 [Entophlyctis luteolus]KAJ3352967.1 hypothetical protein HDU83_007483 [Entophlyctis luteolus]KAJ3388693.1 hypothetical protein HDU84_009538 [Entophlyctis sp. JEL0112]
MAPTLFSKLSDATFHRKFEETAGFLSHSEFPPLDWRKKDDIEQLFPLYRREQLKFDNANEQRSKVIDIAKFTLKSPGGAEVLFDNAKLFVEGNKRSALFGNNGSGKTTLFEAINNGEIQGFPSYLHVHHMKELEQHSIRDAVSVIDTVLCSHPFRRILLAVRDKLEELISGKDGEVSPADLAALNSNLAYVNKNIDNVHGSAENALAVAQSMLRVLGFDETGEKQPLSALSGGLRMRVALACAFFINPEVLLLDEPTNHLDLPSVLWLENKLRGYKGSFLLVTHDRTLLENVVTSVMLISEQKLKYYSCDFKEFEVRKEQEDAEYEKMVDTFLLRNKNLNPMSPLIKQQRQYMLWKEQRQARRVLLQSKFSFPSPKELPLGPGEATQADISLIKVENVRFSYDPAKGLPFIFDVPISYEIKMGTRVGIMGPNGAGKSTFLKLITQKIFPVEGTISLNQKMTVAYFGQHSTKELNLEDSALDFMTASFPKDAPGVLKAHLERTSVTDAIMHTRMKNLSFSQRSCVIFAKLTYVPPHLLILDEPTNFLDLETVGSLITACNKFKGGLIIVTHNRDFLKKCSRTFLSIIPGFFLEFDNMKSAERATYSFMQALEEGKQVDAKAAIQQNRGGGAILSKEDIAINNARRQAIMEKEKAEKAAAVAEAERQAAEAAEKEAKLKAKAAAQKTDWVAGDSCWAPVGGKYVQGVVVRNVPAVGVTVELSTGAKALVEAKKLKTEDPGAGAGSSTNSNASAASSKAAPGAKAGRGAGRGAAATAGGRGGSAGRGRGAR